MFLIRLIIILFCICVDDNTYILHIGVRANIHLGGQNKFCPFARMANTNCLLRGPAREKK